jgi:hypothetical protein
VKAVRRISAVVCVALVSAGTASADPGSLYRGPGPRPGPNILYEAPATAPQMTNTGVWRASPILVSGASAYRSGEFLYQDFLYDDHGANGGQRDPNDPRAQGTSGDLFAAPDGTYTYPTNPAYAMNAADLVELRVKPLADATAFRITLNTLKDPSLVATTIAIGGTPGVNLPWPHGANVTGPGQFFVTVHGTTADFTNAAGIPIGSAPSVTVDTFRRQIEVDVPHSDWNPSGVVRLAAGVGLWDNAAGRYLLPQNSADSTHPGGAGLLATPPAFFNVAFRFHEPFPSPQNPNDTFGNAAWWRDQAQGDSLRSGDISPFFANVDFGKLAAGTEDDSGVPATGAMDRILQSHFETEQGIDYSSTCGEAQSCPGEYRGNLQPYAIYIPPKPPPASGYGMTLLLHSLSASYNQFLGTRNQSQFGDRGTGSIVITPQGRGPDGWYYDAAGADTFEVWADVAARFHLNPDWTVVTGYSMGGYGTFKFATQYPDLFAKGQPTVGPPGLGIWVPPAPPTGGDSTNTFHMLASLRNIPFLMWVQKTDELVPFAGTETQARGFDGLGYRYIFDAYTPGDHLTLAVNDQYQPAADWLGTTRVNRNPAHVTYVRNPTMDFSHVGTTADHAYWLSGIRLRNGSGSTPLGTIDVRSEGFGQGDPTPGSTQVGAGALTGGFFPAIAFSQQSKSWGGTPHTRSADRLDIHATNIANVVINTARARVDCHVALAVTTDGPLAVHLSSCPGVRRFAATVRRMRISVRPKRIRAGARTTLIIHVVTGRGRGRPVSGVTVRIHGRHARTGRRGIARITLRLRRVARYRVTATKRGFRSAHAFVRVVRPRHPAPRRDADGDRDFLALFRL